MNARIDNIYSLLPKKQGDFTIGPIPCTVGGKQYYSNKIGVRVTGAGQQSQGRKKQMGNIFAEMKISKRSCFVNEQVILTFQLYTRVNLWQVSLSPPQFQGFWSENLPEVQPRQESIDGVLYAINESKTALFPSRTGDLEIGAASVTCYYSPFQQPVTVKTEPLKIKVLPLPGKGKPADFKGDVGSYSIKSSISRKSVPANQSVTMNIEISGRGNVKGIEAPKFTESSQLNIYLSSSSESVKKDNYALEGTKKFEFVIIPRVAGKISVPPFSFDYFDPDRGLYKKLETPSYALEVTPESASASSAVPAAAAKSGFRKEVEQVGDDIRYIKTAPGRHSDYRPYFKTRWFYILLAVPVLLYLLNLVYYKAMRSSPARELTAAYKREQVNIARSMKELKKCAGRDAAGFYAAARNIMESILSGAYNLSKGEIVDDVLGEKLSALCIPREDIDGIKAIFASANELRYSSVQTSPTREEISRAEAIIKKFLAVFRKKSRQFDGGMYFVPAANALMIAVFIVLTLTGSMGKKDGAVSDLFSKGCSAYTGGDYKKAESLFSAITLRGIDDPMVNYNLGNAYFRMDSLGQAVRHYRKAALVAPGDEDINYNLAFAVKKRIDKIEIEEDLSFRATLLRAAGNYNPNTVLRFFLPFYAAFWIVLLVYLRFRRDYLRNIFIILLFVNASLLGGALLSYFDKVNRKEAVILSEVADVKSEPDDRSPVIFTLHEGTELDVVNERQGWLGITLGKKIFGWIKEKDAGLI